MSSNLTAPTIFLLAVEADEVYVNQAGIDLMKFGEGRAKQPIHEIQGVELDAWITAQRIKKKGKDLGKPWGLSTKKTWISLFSGLWETAIAIDAAVENITEKLQKLTSTIASRSRGRFRAATVVARTFYPTMLTSTSTPAAMSASGLAKRFRPDQDVAKDPD